jgi:cellulose synthase/poly-beta-1,6-N-acetylglucosamine synthase-like glycosyltransferase
MSVYVIHAIYAESEEQWCKLWKSLQSLHKYENRETLLTGYVRKDMWKERLGDVCQRWINFNLHLCPQNKGKSLHIREGLAAFSVPFTVQYLFLVDSDIVLKTSVVEDLVRVLESDSTIGIVAPMHTGDIRHHATIFQHTKQIGSLVINCSDLLESVAGGCWMVRKSLWKAVGGYKEVGLYGPEDIQFVKIAHKCGFKTVVCTSLSVHHPETFRTMQNNVILK